MCIKAGEDSDLIASLVTQPEPALPGVVSHVAGIATIIGPDLIRLNDILKIDRRWIKNCQRHILHYCT